MSAFRWRVRVYWEDTDGGGVVYYANYLRFLERARSEWLRSFGHSQRALAADAGLLFTVVTLEVEYRAPARLDDELEVSCAARADGAASLRFEQRICRMAPGAPPGELLLEAEVRIACVDSRTMRPRRLPHFLTEALARGGADG